jgi:hypothetical protein
MKSNERKITMKKVLFTLLGMILILGVLGGAGFTGYRFGYMQGALAGGDGTAIPFTRGFNFAPQGMPMHNFSRDFNHGFHHPGGLDGFGMMSYGRGFGFFSPLSLIVRLAVLGLVLWLVYKLFKGNGWQLSLTRQAVEGSKAEATTPDKKES